jgi:hypothetical protein
MRNLFVIHAILSLIIILDVIVGRVFKEQRSDTYDLGIVSTVFAYWSKSPSVKLKGKKEDKILKPEEKKND